MSERFHIIVTSESGRSTSLQLSKKKFFISAATAIFTIVVLCITTYFTTGSYLNSKLLTREVKQLRLKLAQIERVDRDYSVKIAVLKKEKAETLATLNEKHAREVAALKERYFATIASLKKEHTETIVSLKAKQSATVASLKEKQSATVASLIEDHETLLTERKMQFDLENTNLRLTNVRLVATAVNDLKERSNLIESVMSTVGVKLKKEKKDTSQKNTGGPFIPAEEKSYEDLLQQVDDYLNTIRTLPLGKPVSGKISSRFGKRADPVNKKKAFHEGVDIRGKKGDKIRATASGKVIKALKNSGYGNYVEIDHGNGYVTAFGHMQNYLVKKGEVVEQGQIIGQVGNTGRSTGPHLHYEIRLNKKLINPADFMKVADLTHTIPVLKE